jgi:hypothetical protein
MRSKLAQAVRRQFEEQLHATCPQFARDREALLPPGWNAYRWQARPDLACYLVLCLHSKQDSFAVECAWSSNGPFPKGTLRSPRDIEFSRIRRDEPKDGEFRFRLALLWQDRDHWWWLVPEEQVNARLTRFEEALLSGDDAEIRKWQEDPPIEEAKANVRPMVDAAMEKITLHALPYFEKLRSAWHGQDTFPWPSDRPY